MNTSPAPTVSIVLPVFNAQTHLRAALESVRRQTFADWELILVDDASTDGSPAILEEWARADARCRVIRNPRNLGLGGALDVGMFAARGPFIARMDADDISRPERLEKQVAFLRAHPEVVVVGTQVQLIDLEGRPTGRKEFALDHDTLYRMMYVAVPMQHPTIMINRTLVPADFTWYEGWPHGEDTLLFFKLTRYGRMANLPEVLVDYRYYPGSTSIRNAKRTFHYTYRARQRACREMGYRPTVRQRCINRLQWLAVNCLPNALVPVVYAALRKALLRST